MVFSVLRMPSIVALTAFTFAGLGCASAAATFDASSTVNLEITGVTNLTNPGDLADLEITGFADVFDADSEVIGSGSVAIDPRPFVSGDPFALEVGDGVSLSSVVGGSATDGSAEAFSLLDGFVALDNLSFTDTFLIEFSLDYTLAVSTVVGNPSTDVAFAAALLDVITAFDTIVFEGLELGPSAPGGALSVMDEVRFELTVAPGEADAVFLFADAEGFARAQAVPIPGTLLLFVSGLFGLLCARWARRM